MQTAGRRLFFPRPWRWVLTVVCLLASYAYLTREPDPAMPSGMTMTGSMAAPAQNPTASQTPQHMTSDMPGMGMPGDAMPPHSESDVYVGGPNAPPAGHDHSTHCPFCFTAAFALTAVDVFMPAFGLERGVVQSLPHHGVSRRAAIHADARAPPA